jgi:WD40 repeat protein
MKILIGSYVSYKEQTHVVTKLNGNETVQILNPHSEKVNSKKSVLESNLDVLPYTPMTRVEFKPGEDYLVSVKGTIISLTSCKVMKWDENNGKRKQIIQLARG